MQIKKVHLIIQELKNMQSKKGHKSSQVERQSRNEINLYIYQGQNHTHMGLKCSVYGYSLNPVSLSTILSYSVMLYDLAWFKVKSVFKALFYLSVFNN